MRGTYQAPRLVLAWLLSMLALGAAENISQYKNISQYNETSQEDFLGNYAETEAEMIYSPPYNEDLSPPPIDSPNPTSTPAVNATPRETMAEYDQRHLLEEYLKDNYRPIDTAYYSLVRLDVAGGVEDMASALHQMESELKLQVATHGAEVSRFVIDYVATVLTNHVDPASGLSGTHRRLMDMVSNQTEILENHTAVILAVQSQSWTVMQQVTASVNAQNLAASINGRNILQVSAVSSTVSYTVPGPAEALNFLRFTSPSLTALNGLQYNSTTQRWTVKMDLMMEDGNLAVVYITKMNQYYAGDVNNPCVQPTASLCCVWDVVAKYWTAEIPFSSNCTAGLTAQQFFDSLPRKVYATMDHPLIGVRTFFASAADEASKRLSVELTQSAVESYVSTVMSTTTAIGANRFGIGLLVIRPNPTSSPDAMVDFTVFDVFSINNFLFSMRSTQDYTVVGNIQASLHEVYYPTYPDSPDYTTLYYANINFNIPEDYRMVSTPGNILSYLGTQQVPFSSGAWQPHCDLYGEDPNDRLEPSCKNLVMLNPCHPVQHNFFYRPGININLQIPFNPDLTVPGIHLYVSMLVLLQDLTGVKPPVYTNVVASVPITGFIKHCKPVPQSTVTFPETYVTLQIRTGLALGSTITRAINNFTQSLGLDSEPLASYSIDLTGENLVRSITDALVTIKLTGAESYFTANPDRHIYIDQVVTVHTRSNDTIHRINDLIKDRAAYYSIPPNVNSPMTQLVLRPGLLDLCDLDVPNNETDCFYRHEIFDRLNVNPFYTHQVGDQTQDLAWLKTIIGTSQYADQLAVNITDYQGVPGGADPRYNKVLWVYPAYKWENTSFYRLTDYVVTIVAFSIIPPPVVPAMRRLLEDEGTNETDQNQTDEDLPVLGEEAPPAEIPLSQIEPYADDLDEDGDEVRRRRRLLQAVNDTDERLESERLKRWERIKLRTEVEDDTDGTANLRRPQRWKTMRKERRVETQ